jgi:hypothetical protein
MQLLDSLSRWQEVPQGLGSASLRLAADAYGTPYSLLAISMPASMRRDCTEPSWGRTAGAGRVELWWGIGTCAVDITCSNAYPVSLERPAGDARIELGGPGSLRFLRWLETAAENAVVRSTKKHSDKDVDRQSRDRSEDIVEALQDDDEVVVDGFQRVSVLGLEVMTLDGPLRVRTMRAPVDDDDEHLSQ